MTNEAGRKNMDIQHIPIDPMRKREQWLALKKDDLTASDIGAVCGEGLFGSAARVFAEKKGLLGEREMTEAMKKGIWGEAAVFDALAWECPDWEIKRAKVYMRDPQQRLGATPDGAAIIPGRDGLAIIQAKVVSKTAFVRHWLDDPEHDDPHNPNAPATVPLGYQLQVLTESMLAEAASPIIAALVTDEWRWTLRVFDVPRNAEAEQRVRDLVAFFWREHLDPNVPPPIDPARDEELVKLLYPTDNGETLNLTADNRMPGLLDRLEAIKATIKPLEKEKKEIETEIKCRMGSYAYANLRDGRSISLKTQKRSAFYTAETSYRVLRTHTAVGRHIRREDAALAG
jgi:predicted phage-related endonuclease